MKTTKKIFAVLIAFVLTLSMAIPAFAAGDNTITVQNATKDETYTLYQMAKLTADKDKTTYSYTVLEAWKAFFAMDEVKDYFKVDKEGRLTAVEGLEDDSEAMIKIAKLAVEYAEKDEAIKGSDAIGTVVTDEDGEPVLDAEGNEKVAATFTNLAEGYYVISSTLGTRAIIASTPTNKEAVIREKNEGPSLEKEVKEDSTGTFGETNDAEVGQEVEFKVTITAKANAKNYVMHDKMQEGLTFDAESVAIAGLTKGVDYTVVTDTDDDCTFEIKFTQKYLDTITEDTDIVVTYSAVLNEDALIDEDGVQNDAKLTYGDKQKTEWDETTTTTHEMDLLKYKGADLEEGTKPEDVDAKYLETYTLDPLAGAVFQLKNDKGEVVKLVKMEENIYRLATDKDAEADIVTEFTTTGSGHIFIKGLDGDKYTLTEIEAPEGYNILDEAIEVVINATTELVTVANFGGSELPSTGGIGTTIFYAVGGTLVVAAAVVLIVRRRMRGADEA